MVREDLPPVGGYVLAGGRSSRMGRDKALLQIGDKLLVEHAVTKLRRLCADVNILGSDPELETTAPLVRDIHSGCGPLSGIEAALVHSRHDWNLILPVDMPFLPTRLLDDWLWSTLHKRSRLAKWLSFWRPEPIDEIRISMVSVDATPHPALLIIHREIAPYLTRALERGEFKLLPTLESAAKDIAAKAKISQERAFLKKQWDDPYAPAVQGADDPWRFMSKEQGANCSRWFANLNTPEEFAEAERHVDALDT
jgi:molybdopterin-guanine dinucleotide biosynthesis protein A